MALGFGLGGLVVTTVWFSLQASSFLHTLFEDVAGGGGEEVADGDVKREYGDKVQSTIGHSGPFGRQWVVIIWRVKRAKKLTPRVRGACDWSGGWC